MNSTQTVYSFGQHGSAFLDTYEQCIYAPHGLVVVAIQMVTNTGFTQLIAETKSIPLVGDVALGTSTTHLNRGKEYIGTAVAAHDAGDCIIAGASSILGGSNTGTTVTHTANTAGAFGRSAIKVGMQVVSLTDNDYPRDGLLGRPVTIKSITDTTHFELSDNAVGTALSSQSLTGMQMHCSGYGGVALATNDVFPAGMTIVGRWTKICLTEGAAGHPSKVICYFGI